MVHELHNVRFRTVVAGYIGLLGDLEIPFSQPLFRFCMDPEDPCSRYVIQYLIGILNGDLGFPDSIFSIAYTLQSFSAYPTPPKPTSAAHLTGPSHIRCKAVRLSQ